MQHLGQKSIVTPEQEANPASLLDTFPSPETRRPYEICFEFPEFTSLCPVTGQPDFATITITYTPDKDCVEMKSLKLYFFAWRNKGAFYEAITNQILDDLVAAVKPHNMTVVGKFNPRGGTSGTITAKYQRSGALYQGKPII